MWTNNDSQTRETLSPHVARALESEALTQLVLISFSGTVQRHHVILKFFNWRYRAGRIFPISYSILIMEMLGRTDSLRGSSTYMVESWTKISEHKCLGRRYYTDMRGSADCQNMSHFDWFYEGFSITDHWAQTWRNVVGTRYTTLNHPAA